MSAYPPPHGKASACPKNGPAMASCAPPEAVGAGVPTRRGTDVRADHGPHGGYARVPAREGTDGARQDGTGLPRDTVPPLSGIRPMVPGHRGLYIAPPVSRDV